MLQKKVFFKVFFSKLSAFKVKTIFSKRERKKERERERERERETERDKERQREPERDKERQRHTETLVQQETSSRQIQTPKESENIVKK